jgi:hypothetical protein
VKGGIVGGRCFKAPVSFDESFSFGSEYGKGKRKKKGAVVYV